MYTTQQNNVCNRPITQFVVCLFIACYEFFLEINKNIVDIFVTLDRTRRIAQ